MTETNRPNILLIQADQLAAPFLPIYGHPIVQAPAIDRLAENGVVFESAYCNSPLCAPSRFSMMSGQLVSAIGAYDNAAEFPSAIPTMAHYLRAAGYRTSLAGKMHFVGADQLHGFEHRSTTDIYPADFGWTPDWQRFEERADHWMHNMDSVVNAGVAEATNQLDYDDEVGFQAIRTLRNFARESDDRPWFLTASFTHPHDPYVTRRKYWDLYDHEAIDLPRVDPLSGAALDPHTERLRYISDMARAEITDEHIATARHAYYGSISYVDDWVGQLLDALDATGMADNTVVIFTADHGDMLGERGLWYKMAFYENAMRVPLIIRQPGRADSGRTISEHASLVDLLPTLVDLGAATPEGGLPAAIAGQSLMPLIDGDREPDRTVLGEYFGEGSIGPMMMIRRGDMKYVWSEADPPQLFDLANDPDELRNLAGDPDSAALADAFVTEVHERWDPAAIREHVLQSQQSRRIVDSALRSGQHLPWDFQPAIDASGIYMRNHLDLNEVESSRRLPDHR